MNKQSLDERIEAYVSEHQYIDGDLRPVPQNEYLDELKQLISDTREANTRSPQIPSKTDRGGVFRSAR